MMKATYVVVGAGNHRHHTTLAEARQVYDTLNAADLLLVCWLAARTAWGKEKTEELLETKGRTERI
jgi:hypothetical protein